MPPGAARLHARPQARSLRPRASQEAARRSRLPQRLRPHPERSQRPLRQRPRDRRRHRSDVDAGRRQDHRRDLTRQRVLCRRGQGRLHRRPHRLGQRHRRSQQQPDADLSPRPTRRRAAAPIAAPLAFRPTPRRTQLVEQSVATFDPEEREKLYIDATKLCMARAGDPAAAPPGQHLRHAQRLRAGAAHAGGHSDLGGVVGRRNAAPRARGRTLRAPVPPAPAVPLRRRHRHRGASRPCSASASGWRMGGRPGATAPRRSWPSGSTRIRHCRTTPTSSQLRRALELAARRLPRAPGPHRVRPLRHDVRRSPRRLCRGTPEPARRRVRPGHARPRRARRALPGRRRSTCSPRSARNLPRPDRSAHARPRRLRPRPASSGCSGRRRTIEARHTVGLRRPDHGCGPIGARRRRPAGDAGGGRRHLRPPLVQAESGRRPASRSRPPRPHRCRAGPLARLPSHAGRQRAIRRRRGGARALARDRRPSAPAAPGRRRRLHRAADPPRRRPGRPGACPRRRAPRADRRIRRDARRVSRAPAPSATPASPPSSARASTKACSTVPAAPLGAGTRSCPARI